MKKCLFLALVLVLCNVLFFGSASAEQLENGFVYLAANGETHIVDYKGYEPVVVVPANLGGYPVTRISEGAFANNAVLESIELPSSIKTIESAAFAGCVSLYSVKLPNGIDKVPPSCFSGCLSLQNISLPVQVTSIGDFSFFNAGITGIELPSKLSSIGRSAFSECKSLREIVIPGSVRVIKENAFENCKSLESVTIQNGVEEIQQYSFGGCLNLSSIQIPRSVSKIAAYAWISQLTGESFFVEYYVDQSNGNYLSVDGVVFSSDGLSLLFYPQQKRNSNYTIPDNTVEIGPYAFYRNRYLQNVIIPVSVKSIGGGAFDHCANLDSINAPGVASVGSWAFSRSGISQASLPSVVSFGQNAFESCRNLTKVVLSSKLKTIGYYMFSGCSSLEEIIVPIGVISIDENAFSGTGITKIYIPKSTIDISSSAMNKYISVSVFGYVGSYAEEYANAHGYSFTPFFLSLDGPQSMIIDETVQIAHLTNNPYNPVPIIEWSSSDENILTVNQSGFATAIMPGNVLITAAAQDEHDVFGKLELNVNKKQYDMSGVAWNYSEAFTHDGTVKTVALSGLPESVTPEYSGNAATEAGTYIASVTFTYDTVNYEAPIMPDLTWVIEPAVVPVLKGDATNDGTIDILDLVSIIDYIVSNNDPTSLANADANADGMVDILDLVWIIDRIVGG